MHYIQDDQNKLVDYLCRIGTEFKTESTNQFLIASIKTENLNNQIEKNSILLKFINIKLIRSFMSKVIPRVKISLKDITTK